MEEGQIVNIPLDASIDVDSSDMMANVNDPTLSHNRQLYQGSILPNSLRYEHDGWFAGWYAHEFNFIDSNKITDDKGKEYIVSKQQAYYSFFYNVQCLDSDVSFVYYPETSLIKGDGSITREDNTVTIDTDDFSFITDGNTYSVNNGWTVSKFFFQNDIFVYNAILHKQVLEPITLTYGNTVTIGEDTFAYGYDNAHIWGDQFKFNNNVLTSSDGEVSDIVIDAGNISFNYALDLVCTDSVNIIVDKQNKQFDSAAVNVNSDITVDLNGTGVAMSNVVKNEDIVYSDIVIPSWYNISIYNEKQTIVAPVFKQGKYDIWLEPYDNDRNIWVEVTFDCLKLLEVLSLPTSQIVTVYPNVSTLDINLTYFMFDRQQMPDTYTMHLTAEDLTQSACLETKHIWFKLPIHANYVKVEVTNIKINMHTGSGSNTIDIDINGINGPKYFYDYNNKMTQEAWNDIVAAETRDNIGYLENIDIPDDNDKLACTSIMPTLFNRADLTDEQIQSLITSINSNEIFQVHYFTTKCIFMDEFADEAWSKPSSERSKYIHYYQGSNRFYIDFPIKQDIPTSCVIEPSAIFHYQTSQLFDIYLFANQPSVIIPFRELCSSKNGVITATDIVGNKPALQALNGVELTDETSEMFCPYSLLTWYTQGDSYFGIPMVAYAEGYEIDQYQRQINWISIEGLCPSKFAGSSGSPAIDYTSGMLVNDKYKDILLLGNNINMFVGFLNVDAADDDQTDMPFALVSGIDKQVIQRIQRRYISDQTGYKHSIHSSYYLSEYLKNNIFSESVVTALAAIDYKFLGIDQDIISDINTPTIIYLDKPWLLLNTLEAPRDFELQDFDNVMAHWLTKDTSYKAGAVYRHPFSATVKRGYSNPYNYPGFFSILFPTNIRTVVNKEDTSIFLYKDKLGYFNMHKSFSLNNDGNLTIDNDNDREVLSVFLQPDDGSMLYNINDAIEELHDTMWITAGISDIQFPDVPTYITTGSLADVTKSSRAYDAVNLSSQPIVINYTFLFSYDHILKEVILSSQCAWQHGLFNYSSNCDITYNDNTAYITHLDAPDTSLDYSFSIDMSSGKVSFISNSSKVVYDSFQKLVTKKETYSAETSLKYAYVPAFTVDSVVDGIYTLSNGNTQIVINTVDFNISTNSEALATNIVFSDADMQFNLYYDKEVALLFTIENIYNTNGIIEGDVTDDTITFET